MGRMSESQHTVRTSVRCRGRGLRFEARLVVGRRFVPRGFRGSFARQLFQAVEASGEFVDLLAALKKHLIEL